MTKKRGTWKEWIVIFILLLFVALIIIFSASDVETNDVVEVDNVTNTEQLTPPEVDFMSVDGGTFNGWAGATYYKEPIDDPVVLFVSAKVPGMSLLYYPHKKLLVGGTPQMIAEDIDLFQGEKHQITYSFDKGEKQRLFYDGKIVAESEFKLYENSLTGMATGVAELYVSKSLDEVEIS